MLKWIKKIDIGVILILLFLFTKTKMYFMWWNQFWSNFSLVLAIFLILFFFISIVRKSSDSRNSVIAIIFCLSYAFQAVNNGSNILGFIMALMFPTCLMLPYNKREKSIDLLINYVLPLLLSLSLISYILFILGIYNWSGEFIEHPNSTQTITLYKYPFFVMRNSMESLGRFFAYFDEPGVVGTLSATFIFLAGKKLKSISLYIYIICGILSFSLFFYIIFALAVFTKKIQINTNFFYVLLALFAGWVLLSIIDKDSFQHFVLDRLLFEDGSLSGNDRNSESFYNYYKNTFLHSSDLLFGAGENANVTGGSFSIQVFIYRYGLFVVTLFSLVYFAFIRKYKVNNKDFIFNLIFMIALNYQRPCFWDPLYFMLITTLIEMNYIHSNVKDCDRQEVLNNSECLCQN